MLGMRLVKSSRMPLPRVRAFAAFRVWTAALVGLICAFGMTASSTTAAGGGAAFSDQMPAGSTLTRIEIYADTRVNGIRLMTDKGALPLRGSASGVLNTFDLSADERILQLSKAFDGDVLVRVDFRTEGGRNFGHGVDPSALTGPNVRLMAQRPAGVREFSGLSGSAGDALYDVSMISRTNPAPTSRKKTPPPLPPTAAPAPGAVPAAGHGGPDPFETGSNADSSAAVTPKSATDQAQNTTVDGVWYDADFTVQKNSAGFDARAAVFGLNTQSAGDEQTLNGNYTTPALFRFVPQPGGKSVKLYAETPDGLIIQNEYATGDGKTYVSVVGAGSAPFDSFEFDTRTERGKFLRTLYTKIRGVAGPELYPSQRPDADVAYDQKDDQRSAFLIAHNLPSKQFNFSGYDIGSVDALDLTSHSKGVIFDENVGPKDYAERGNYVVPYGLAYKTDGHEATTYVEHEIGSQKEHQTSVSNSVGLSVGAKEVGKVGVKVGWSNTQGKSDDSTQMASYGVARVNKYALVLDPPNMELNARFRQDVKDLRDGRLQFDKFIARYGTHYPYAVTYGAMATTEYAFDGSEYADWTSQGLDVGVQASAVIKGAKAGADYDYKSTDETRRSASRSEGVKRYKAIGGSGGWDEGHFSAAEGKEVPVLMDLRPIWRLLSPVYFDDPAIFLDLRNRLRTAAEAYVASLPDPDDRDFRPVVWKLSLDNFRCDADYRGFLGAWGDFSVQVSDGQTTFPAEKQSMPDKGATMSCPRKPTETSAVKFSKIYWTPKPRLQSTSINFTGNLKSRRSIDLDYEFYPNQPRNPAIYPFKSVWASGRPGGKVTVERSLGDARPESKSAASVAVDLTIERLVN